MLNFEDKIKTEPEIREPEPDQPAESETVQTVQDSPVDYWDLMSGEDRKYARTKPNQDLCPWCKRRTSHHPACMVDSDEWALKMPFGKYKDKPIRDIEPSYLEWVLTESGMELTEDIEEEIRTLLFQV